MEILFLADVMLKYYNYSVLPIDNFMWGCVETMNIARSTCISLTILTSGYLFTSEQIYKCI